MSFQFAGNALVSLGKATTTPFQFVLATLGMPMIEPDTTPVMMALAKFAPVNVAPVNVARVNVAPVRSTVVRLAPAKVAPVRSKLLSIAPVKSAPARSAPGPTR